MPARRLADNILRQWINSSGALGFSIPQKWCPPPRLLQGFATRTVHSNIAPFTAQQKHQDRRLDFEQEGDGEPPLAQREPSMTHSLHQRLKYPKRRRGYEGNNVTPKVKKNKIISEVNDEHAVNPRSSKGKPKWKAKSTEELEEYLKHDCS